MGKEQISQCFKRAPGTLQDHVSKSRRVVFFALTHGDVELISSKVSTAIGGLHNHLLASEIGVGECEPGHDQYRNRRTTSGRNLLVASTAVLGKCPTHRRKAVRKIVVHRPTDLVRGHV